VNEGGEGVLSRTRAWDLIRGGVEKKDEKYLGVRWGRVATGVVEGDLQLDKKRQ